jgi:hypothetical protein
MDIAYLRRKLKNKEYRITLHATKKRLERGITTKEIEEAINNGKIIESYEKDKYAPSCLVFGFTNADRPIHVVLSYTPIVWVITVYEPDEKEWIDFEKRRKCEKK